MIAQNSAKNCKKIPDYRRSKCSQKTGERLTSAVPKWGSEMLALLVRGLIGIGGGHAIRWGVVLGGLDEERSRKPGRGGKTGECMGVI